MTSRRRRATARFRFGVCCLRVLVPELLFAGLVAGQQGLNIMLVIQSGGPVVGRMCSTSNDTNDKF